MIELARHIEALLLENDCVVVPNLGGFVAHYTPATRQEEESTFVPPTRCIAFNPQLLLNDGLLAQSYSSVYGISFPEATRRMERDVRALARTLHEKGEAELPGVGLLTCSIHNAYNFTPYNHLLTTPSLYGLESFAMPTLAAAEEERQHSQAASTDSNQQDATRKAATRQAAQRRQDEASRVTEGDAQLAARQAQEADSVVTAGTMGPTEPRSAHIGTKDTTPPHGSNRTNGSHVRRLRHANLRPILAHAAIVVLAVATFFLLSTPIDNARLTSATGQADLQPQAFWQLMQQPLPQAQPSSESPEQIDPAVTPESATSQFEPDSNAAEPDIEATEPSGTTVAETDSSPKEPDGPVVEPAAAVVPASLEAQDLHYHVIVASLATASDAETVAQDFRSRGYEQARAIIGDGRNRVAILSYAKAAEAYAILPTINEREGIDGAWVLHN